LGPRRVLDDYDRFLQYRLDRLPGLPIVNNEPARGAAASLLDRGLPGLRDIRLPGQVPDPPGPHAEPGMDAEVLHVFQFQRRPLDLFRVPEVGLAAGALGPVEVDRGVRAVTEWLVPRMAAPAEGIALPYGIPDHFLPCPAVPFVIITDLLPDQGDAPGDEVGAVFTDNDLHTVMGWRGCGRVFFCHGLHELIPCISPAGINRFGSRGGVGIPPRPVPGPDASGIMIFIL